MDIKFLDVHAHTGGLYSMTAVVGGDIKTLSQAKIKPEEYELIIRKKTHKRSLDANSYYWLLVNKLARVMGISDDELHRKMLEDYGVFDTKDGEIVTFTARADIEVSKFVKYTKVLATGRINGLQAVKYGVLKGSSEMNSKEFSDLLDGLIHECKEQGIETLPPHELEQIKRATL